MANERDDMIIELLKLQAEERKEATKATVGALNEVKQEIRASRVQNVTVTTIMIVLLSVIILARDGVFAKIGIPGFSVETQASNEHP